MTALTCGRERDGRKCLIRAAGDLYVGSADRLGERHSLCYVPFSVPELTRPGFDDPKVHQGDRAQFGIRPDQVTRPI